MPQNSPTSMASRLDAVGISKCYGTFRALTDINVTISPGEFLTLLGPSGSGKTTFLMSLAGFAAPTSGEILENGEEITHRSPDQRNFGMVFQGYALFPHMSVLENVIFPLKLRKISKDERTRRAKDMLDRVGLAAHIAKRPSELSGGQQQRVALARSLVYRPPVLLLDEPFSALDKALKSDLQSELRSIHRDLGTTCVFVTHDQSEALALSDRIAIFNEGSISQIGAPREIYRHPNNRFVANFLGRINLMRLSDVSLQQGMATGLHGGVTLRCHTDRADGRLREATLAVRPEYVRLEQAFDRGNSLPVTVTEVVYNGSCLSISVLTSEGTKLLVDVPDQDNVPKPGDHGHVTWAAADGALLPDGQV
ncbi:ABC transporter ATP-binding protein [Brucella sp. C7-11G]